jgi:hypothetical protein
MSSLHSLLDNLTLAGTIYGWRIDAMLLGGLLWALAAGFGELRTSPNWAIAQADRYHRRVSLGA